MKRLTNEQIMDYLDGALSPEERAVVEAHLIAHPEDAECVRELQFALGAMKEWHHSDELRVSENFWPTLREQLGPAPQRSWWSRVSKSLNQRAESLVVSPRASRWSLGAAVAAAVVALGLLFFAPQNASTPVVADLTPADEAFITEMVQQHETFVQSQPMPGERASTPVEADEPEDDSIR